MVYDLIIITINYELGMRNCALSTTRQFLIPNYSTLLIPLKLLSEDEVEVAAAFLSEYAIETICPVNTHHADHRKEDADTGSRRTLKVKRWEIFYVGPRITTLGKHKPVDRGARLQHEREV